ncbi:hypothetical protein HDV00_002301 [Rhizophlyctis rosea]|nr:hypothetical protein HDV00_002301 [Rhizophlyctis rosea]
MVLGSFAVSVRSHIWLGTIVGLLLSILIGSIFIAIWYKYATNAFESHELLWEGSFALIGCILITVMAIAMLRAAQPGHQDRWKKKLMGQIHDMGAASEDGREEAESGSREADIDRAVRTENRGDGWWGKVANRLGVAGRNNKKQEEVEPRAISVDHAEGSGSQTPITEPPDTRRNSTSSTSRLILPPTAPQTNTTTTTTTTALTTTTTLFTLPFITILREGLEAMLFLGGVTLSSPPISIPLPATLGILTGCLIGYIIYHYGSSSSTSQSHLHKFFILSTQLLLLIAAGLFTKAIYAFETTYWFRHIWLPNGNGGGDEGPALGYNVRHSVWHLECCGREVGGWGVLNALVGWNNDGTYGTVGGYCLFWVAVAGVLVGIRRKDFRKDVAERVRSEEGEIRV